MGLQTHLEHATSMSVELLTSEKGYAALILYSADSKELLMGLLNQEEMSIKHSPRSGNLQRLSDLVGSYRSTYRIVHRVLQPLLEVPHII